MNVILKRSSYKFIPFVTITYIILCFAMFLQPSDVIYWKQFIPGIRQLIYFPLLIAILISAGYLCFLYSFKVPLYNNDHSQLDLSNYDNNLSLPVALLIALSAIGLQYLPSTIIYPMLYTGKNMGTLWLFTIGANCFVFVLLIWVINRRFNFAYFYRAHRLKFNSILPLAVLGIALKFVSVSSTALFMRFNSVGAKIPLASENKILEPVLTLNIYYFISIVILVPIIEEMIFRGVLLRSFEKRLGIISAMVITSILFASIHFSLLRFPGLLIEGIIWAWLVYRGNSIFISIFLHAFDNTKSFLSKITPIYYSPNAFEATHQHLPIIITLMIISVILLTVSIRWFLRISIGSPDAAS
jgi:membrane protease YdiL (CAAX protease family)